MSKSRGNVINPDDVVNEYGADTLRLFEMFIGDFEKSAPWSSASIKGCKRFLERTYALKDIAVDGENYSEKLEASFHKTIKKVSEDIENLKYNTAIAALMSLLNEIYDTGRINKAELRTFLLLLNPFAPHITEELWEQNSFGGLLAEAKWPDYDESKTVDNEIEIPVQVNGKLRSTIKIAVDEAQETVLAKAKADGKIAGYTDGKTVIKEIYIKNKMVNIVIK
jgi:leucyl-tRNA synthetase